jgi:hypothetical protein
MAGFHVLRWAAREVPAVRRSDGKADTVAHHVLVCLALYADKDARARPSLSTLAADARLTERATREALRRLVSAGVVAIAGDLNGTAVWRLCTDVKRDADEAETEGARHEKARAQQAERARRYRQRKAERHVEVERDVTSNQSVTNGSVTSNLDERHALLERTSRSTSTNVTPSSPSQSQVSGGVSTNELPLNYQGTIPETSSPGGSEKPRRKPRSSDPLDIQANELTTRYSRAMNDMVAFMGVRQSVRLALDKFTYEQVFEGVRRMATEDRNKTLTRQTLLNAIEARAPTRVNGHTPYRDPDPTEYTKEW